MKPSIEATLGEHGVDGPIFFEKHPTQLLVAVKEGRGHQG